jgi:hypothetical protein
MKCSKCKREFRAWELHLSHDVPKYIGGSDTEGRHYLCKKCHDIYEKKVFAFVVSILSEEHKHLMRLKTKRFAEDYF